MNYIELKDKEIETLINHETKRQQNHIELIASENYVSKDVLNAAGSIFTNKYCEGYPGARYYDGCEFADKVENLAIERVKKLFNVKYANVQPHSGSSANSAAIAALIKPNAKILAMSLDAGGHLSHGYSISFSGIFYQAYFYNVNSDGFIDYDNVLEIAKKVKPDLIICGASSYSRIIDFKKFKEIASQVNAYLLADIAHIAGLVIANLHPSPIEYADIITSTTHKTLRGTRGGIILTNNEEIIKKINRWVFPGYQGGPLLHIVAAKAVSFYEALKPDFISYQKQIVANAKAFSKKFISLGANIITNGTDNHLFIIDVKKTYDLSGKEASKMLQEINITTNKNSIPNDKLKPTISSGIRIGTPAMTTRGLKEKDFEKLAIIIDLLLKNKAKDKNLILDLKKEVKEISDKFPLKDYYI